MFDFIRKPVFRLLETRENYLNGNIKRSYQIEFKLGFFHKYKFYKYLFSKNIDKKHDVCQRLDNNTSITLFNSKPIDHIKPYFRCYNTKVQYSEDELDIVKFIMELLQIIQIHKKFIDKYLFQTFSPILVFVRYDRDDLSSHSGEVYLVNLLDIEIYNNIKYYRCFCLNNIKNKDIVMNYLNEKLITSIKTEKYYL